MSAPKVPPTDPRYRKALDDLAADTGLRIDRVLLPTQWHVVEVDGRVEVVLNVDGMRALALVAPRPDAVEMTEALIKAIEARLGRPAGDEA